jgi:biotin synthase
MGAAWREMGNKTHAFGHILDMVRGVHDMGLEVCATLGMLTLDQAKALKDAGLTSYNHNLDTSPEHYPKVITTRTFQDRLDTLANVREAGLSVCCGGILGLGEKDMDRVGLLHVLATLPEHPESVPINALVSVEGTPLGNKKKHSRTTVPTTDTTTPCGKPIADPTKDDMRQVHVTHTHPSSQPSQPHVQPSHYSQEPEDVMAEVDAFDMIRMIATARIVMPRTMVRLSAGRMSFSPAEQFLMFQAGANSIFSGDQLLTTPNPQVDQDRLLFDRLGLVGKPAHQGPLISPAEVDGQVHITRVVHQDPQHPHDSKQYATA